MIRIKAFMRWSVVGALLTVTDAYGSFEKPACQKATQFTCKLPQKVWTGSGYALITSGDATVGARTLNGSIVVGGSLFGQSANGEATWTGPFSTDIDGTGLGGSFESSLMACKTRCLKDSSCKAIKYTKNDVHDDGNNCFIFDNQADTRTQYKSFHVYKLTRPHATTVTGVAYADSISANPKKLHFNSGVKSIADFGIPFSRFQSIAGSCGYLNNFDGVNLWRVFISTVGGDFNHKDFSTTSPSSDKGHTLVIITSQDKVNITAADDGTAFGPSILAPFAEVNLHGSTGFVDGCIIAKSFKTSGPKANQLRIHGNCYKGPLCTAPPPTTTTTTTTKTTTTTTTTKTTTTTTTTRTTTTTTRTTTTTTTTRTTTTTTTTTTMTTTTTTTTRTTTTTTTTKTTTTATTTTTTRTTFNIIPVVAAGTAVGVAAAVVAGALPAVLTTTSPLRDPVRNPCDPVKNVTANNKYNAVKDLQSNAYHLGQALGKQVLVTVFFALAVLCAALVVAVVKKRRNRAQRNFMPNQGLEPYLVMPTFGEEHLQAIE